MDNSPDKDFEKGIEEIMDPGPKQEKKQASEAERPRREEIIRQTRKKRKRPVPRWVEFVIRILAAAILGYLLFLFGTQVSSF